MHSLQPGSKLRSLALPPGSAPPRRFLLLSRQARLLPLLLPLRRRYGGLAAAAAIPAACKGQDGGLQRQLLLRPVLRSCRSCQPLLKRQLSGRRLLPHTQDLQVLLQHGLRLGVGLEEGCV